MVQWLGLRASTAGGPGSIPGWGTKIPQAVWCDQKRKRNKQKNPLDCDHMITLIDAEKAFDKTQHPFMIKTKTFPTKWI